MSEWQRDVCDEAGADGLPIHPAWADDGVPHCDERCPFHDGKRCEILGSRPSWICAPAVVEMARRMGE